METSAGDLHGIEEVVSDEPGLHSLNPEGFDLAGSKDQDSNPASPGIISKSKKLQRKVGTQVEAID